MMKKIKKSLNYKKFLLPLGIVILVACNALLNCTSCSNRQALSKQMDLTKTTVMITNLSKNSGGSGTILSSNEVESTVLTNKHICDLVEENGGLVIKDDSSEFFIKSFRASRMHDLCVIKVPGDLGESAQIAAHPPTVYEKAVISGHPNLLPTVITEGHASGHRTIAVAVAYRDCTPEELDDPVFGPICGVVGKVPLVKIFDSAVFSATILPGSSGSGIFNSNNELIAVVFAGTAGLSYAYAVPYNYVISFLFEEYKSIPDSFPNTTQRYSSKQENSDAVHDKIAEICESNTKLKNNPICEVELNDVGLE